jgi:hypothetical protein
MQLNNLFTQMESEREPRQVWKASPLAWKQVPGDR